MILSTIVCLIINIFFKWNSNVLWGVEEQFSGQFCSEVNPSDIDIIKILQLLKWISARRSHLHCPGSGEWCICTIIRHTWLNLKKNAIKLFALIMLKTIPQVILGLIFNWYTWINSFMDRHLFIMNSFLRTATLRESKRILFCQQSGTLEKRLLCVSFWCVLMVLISSGMLLAPRDSDVSATIAVRKHWWWIYNTQASTYWPEKWLSICFWSKIGFIPAKNMLPKFPYLYFSETFYPDCNLWLLSDEVFSVRHSWGSHWI